MKLVIDRSIPFIKGVFEPYAEVEYLDGMTMGRDEIRDADGQVKRTRTKCNAELLEGTAVKVIATASIGTDHIDQKYCLEHGIFHKNASGCNAGGVMNYVISALYGTAARHSIQLQGATFGIIGAGNCGTRVADTARTLGFKVLLNDPVRALAEGPSAFCDLNTLLHESDIVSIHVPLNESTVGMVNASFFSKMKYGAFFINTSRGRIVVEEDLIAAIPKLGPVIIDTWENEPFVNHTLLHLADIATPHIAGYSYQGKQYGTAYAVRTIARFFGLKDLYDYFPEITVKDLEAVKVDFRDLTQGQLAATLQYNYPIFTDDFMFRMAPENFIQLRKDYQYRREFYIE